MLKTAIFSIIRSQVPITLALLITAPLLASDYTAKAAKKAAPAALGESIKAELSETVIQISHKDRVMYEFWPRTSLPLKSTPSSPSSALNAIGQTALLGAMTVVADERDYRDDELYEGIYTVRFGLRPEDGNHLGTSEHLFFAVLIDAKNDQELGKITKSKQLVKASSKTSATDHPMILSLFPVNSNEPTSPSVQEPAHKHEAIRLSIPATNPDGSAAGHVVFDLIVEGMADF